MPGVESYLRLISLQLRVHELRLYFNVNADCRIVSPIIPVQPTGLPKQVIMQCVADICEITLEHFAPDYNALSFMETFMSCHMD